MFCNLLTKIKYLLFFSIAIPVFTSASTIATDATPTNLVNTSPSNKASDNQFLDINNVMLSTLINKRMQYQQALLASHPIIVGLFNSYGWQLILYRPHQTPLIAPPLPQALDYRIVASAEHAAITVYTLLFSQLNNAKSAIATKQQIQDYAAKLNLALNMVDQLQITTSEKPLLKQLLSLAFNITNAYLKNNTISAIQLNTYAKNIKAPITQLTNIVVNYQITYWFKVVASWKQMLGSNWNSTYAVVDYIYVNPKHNALLQLLAKFMGPATRSTHLFAFNTTSYAPSADDALKLLVIAEPDHELANKIFGKYYSEYAGILPTTAIKVLNHAQIK